ncbi:MAG: hypothetical protein ACR5LD_07960 [Symbiopectobacterium sp.]
MLDSFAGLWCVNMGHNSPEVKAAIAKQMDKLAYYKLFDGVSHPMAEALSNRIIQMRQQEDIRRMLYSMGGSDGMGIPPSRWRVSTGFCKAKAAPHALYLAKECLSQRTHG